MLVAGAVYDAEFGLIVKWLKVLRDGLGGRQRPGVHGPAAASRPASNRKIAASGQAVGSQRRMRAALSTTRVAILINRPRSVANSAVFQSERLGAAARNVCRSQ